MARKKTGPTMVVDGDVLVYNVAAACQEKFKWERDEITTYIDMRRAKQTADGMLSEWRSRLKCSEIVIALSDHGSNWRKLLLPSYKAHRSKDKPMGYYELETYIEDTYDVVQFPSLEGDDALAMRATDLGPKKAIVVTIDKDMKGVPIPMWNPSFPDVDPVDITVEEADFWHLLQTLMGDKVDNYDGCPGIGPVKAAALLAPFWNPNKKKLDRSGAWSAIIKAYAAAGMSVEEALVQARVARILRHDEYDYNTNKPILWRPQ